MMMIKRFTTVLALSLSMMMTASMNAADLDYADGVLLIRFTEDLTVNVASDGMVTVGEPEMDRLLTRFHATGWEPFFGKMIIKDPEYSYQTRNDYKIFFPDGTNMKLVASEFEQIKGIEWAEPDYLIPLCDFIPNDPSFPTQWWLQMTEAARAWEFQQGDSTVVIGIIDTGIDWHHPDLVDNLWVNPGEDIDDDHRPFDPQFPDLAGTIGDWNFVDDDENGLEEDFLGWDWVTVRGNQIADGEDGNPPDNNPVDFNGHGTGCNSAAAEEGNNGVGGAGMAFGCKLMSLRAGYEAPDGNGYTQSSSGVSALTYAVENGASIISMSYGGGNVYAPMQNAQQFAWDNGVMMFAAAGNDGADINQYPANYEHVIAVAATTPNDTRAGFSNWGNWVSISAPGTSCYTGWFFHNRQNPSGYLSWDGTSVASPIAAGVGALVVSQFPNLTNEDWREIIESTTDPIQTNRYIGTGRVNAYKAVTQYFWPSMEITDLSISDPDGNGHPDLGETIEVSLMVTSEDGWMDAQNVEAHISFDVEGIQLDQETVLLAANMPAGFFADNFNNPLQFTIPENFPSGSFATMYVTVTADPNEYEIGESVRMLIGTPQVILVDDDDGEDYESFIIDDLDSLGLVYNHHDVDALGDIAMSGQLLTQYTNVIWMTGDNVNPLTPNELTALRTAMDAGVNVFLFGQTLDEQLEGTDFYSDYLHAAHVNEDGIMGLDSAPGAPNPPVIPDARMVLNGLGGAGNNDDPDVIEPVNGAIAAYEYANSPNIGGIMYDGDDYKLVYFAFAFEAVSGQALTNTRLEILGGEDGEGGILGWFGFAAPPPPPQDHFIPVEPTGRPYAIVVQNALLDDNPLVNNDEIGLFDGDLCVGAEVFHGTWPLAISAWEGDPARELPGFEAGNPILFKVWSAMDQSEYGAVAEEWVRGNGTFGFGAYSEVVLSAQAAQTMTLPLQGNYFELISTYVAPPALDAADVFGNIASLSIVYQDDGSIYIPPNINTIGDITISEGYQVYCNDADQLEVTGSLLDPATEYTAQANQWNWIGYPYNVEVPLETALSTILDDIQIVMTDDGGVFIPPAINTIGNMTPGEGYFIFVHNTVTFTYNNAALASASEAEITEVPEVEGAPAATGLPYAVLVNLTDELRASGAGTIELYDGQLLVGKSVVLDNETTPVIAWGGNAEQNVEGFVSGHAIQAVVRDAAGNQLGSVNDGIFGEGAYASVTIDANSLPSEFAVETAYPNPFNPSVTVPFSLPQAGEVSIAVYNVMGQQIASSTMNYNAGHHRFVFDAASGNLVSGVYFLQVQFNGQVNTQKVMLLK